MHYYDVQFRLLREDFISPLRKGICDFKKGKTGRDVRNVKVYHDVRIIEVKPKHLGLYHQIQFDSSPFHHYRWAGSSRLIYGSLLCLSPDNFTNKVFFATVIESNPDDLTHGCLDVMFVDCSELLSYKNSGTRFVMVESLAYFEASRHILKSLKDADCQAMPFTNYLITNDHKGFVKPPRYLNSASKSSTYDLQFIVKHKDPHYQVLSAFKKVTITNFAQWPHIEMTELDPSQLAALQMALTQEISVIQGPPGTGKTYIGLKIMEALLMNRHIWNPASVEQKLNCRVTSRFNATPNLSSPILVMCLTNHALDQFLEGILDMHEGKDLKLIRIGGRSKSEKVQACNLKDYKKSLRNVPKEEFQELKELEAAVDVKAEEMQRTMQAFTGPSMKFVPFSKLRESNVIEDHLLRSLLDIAETEEEEKIALELWLGLYDRVDDFGDEDDSDEESDKKRGPSSASENDSDEDSSSEDESTEEDTSDELTDFGWDTAEVPDFAQAEEDSRMIDGTKELLQEIGLSKEELLPTKRDNHISYKPNRRRVTRFKKCRDQGQLKKHIMNQTEMSKKEVRKLRRGVHRVKYTDRFRLYMYWHAKYNALLVQDLEQEFEEYNKLCEETITARNATDKYALETADVIGMTTTGAAKHQHVLHLVKPKIVIVEEAAEVLESHIVSALNAGTQHLILIGDHKQLRPTPNEYDLVVKYKFDISLFERLVRNNLPHTTLEIQHRMRPEIADIVKCHIYEDRLKNHDSVIDYPGVKGVASNLFFINHSHPEKDSELSHSNEYEARFLVNLCSYLLKQDYSPRQITILVAYTGQLLLMKKMMLRDEFNGIRLTTVDNFQGEENDIILLSVVRSNGHGSVGFLSTENRVCVALSRARHGMFCIGNFEMLRSNAAIWGRVIGDMEEKKKLGNHLTICCDRHREKSQFRVQDPEDFRRYKCKEDCQARLPCGHACRLKCHSDDDPDHKKKHRCKQTCPKECPEGHPCKHPCYRQCKCTKLVLKQLPKCGHEQEMECNEDPRHEVCYTKCMKILPKCGHIKEIPCYADVTHERCTMILTKVIPKCGHSQEMECYVNTKNVLCQQNCEKTCPKGHPCDLRCYEKCRPCKVTSKVKLPCGHEQDKFCYQEISDVKCMSRCGKKCKSDLHPCPLRCYQECRACTIPVDAEMPVCGHSQMIQCHQDVSEVKCQAPCKEKCRSGHPCKYPCYEHYVQPQGLTYRGCGDCMTTVRKTQKCGHIKLVECSVDPSNLPCRDPCSKELSCGHRCPKLCYDLCSTAVCFVLVEVKLPCDHVTNIHCHKKGSIDLSLFKCTKPCRRKLPGCDHKCPRKCGEPCPRVCEVADIKRTCDQGHTLFRRCFETLDRYPCDKKCEKKLSCGHKCSRLCHEPCTTNCKKLVVKEYPCGHKHRIHCTVPIEEEPCDYHCKAPLACGHFCKRTCSECFSSHIHESCGSIVWGAHICGEDVKMRCSSLRDSHLAQKPAAAAAAKPRSKMDYSMTQVLQCCMHKEITYSCETERYKCMQPCQWSCRHYKCKRLCHEMCNRQHCNTKCTKDMACGHKCIGLCGEPCINVCPECETEEFEIQYMSVQPFSRSETYIQLPCGDIFNVKYLDQHIAKIKSDGIIGPLQCPECYTLLSCYGRYGNSMKEALKHVDAVKAHVKTLESQWFLPSPHQTRLSSILRVVFSDCSDSRLRSHRDVLSRPMQCLIDRRKKVSGQRLSKEDSFTLFLLATVFRLAAKDTGSVYDYQPMLDTLVAMLERRPMRSGKNTRLSFQMILNLTSELYKLCIQAKLSMCQRVAPAIEIKEEQEFFDQHGDPSTLLRKEDFSRFSKVLDRLLTKHHSSELSFVGTEELITSLECFYPVITNGSWRRCKSNHYYCVPVCEPGVLTMTCPTCTCR